MKSKTSSNRICKTQPKQGQFIYLSLALLIILPSASSWAQDPYVYLNDHMVSPEVFDFQRALASDIYPFIGSHHVGNELVIKAEALLAYAENEFGVFSWLSADALVALSKVCAFNVDQQRRATELAERAERIYRKVLKEHPKVLAERLATIASIYQHTGRDKESRQLFAEASGDGVVKPDPFADSSLYWDTVNKLKYAEIEMNKGESAFLVKDYARAEQAFISAMSLLDQIENQAPLTTHPHFAMHRLIQVYEKQKKTYAAEELYRQALRQWEAGQYSEVWLEKILKDYQRFLQRWWRWDEANLIKEKLSKRSFE